MRFKLIIFLLFLGIIISVYAKPKDIKNEICFAKMESRKKQINGTALVLINPRQIKHVEITIKSLLTSLTKSSNRSIMLRLSSLNGDSLRKAISEICGIIREKFMNFVRVCGFTTSVRQQITWNSTISEDWLSESLVQGSLLLCDLARVSEEIWFTINHYFDTHNISLYEHKKLSANKITSNFQFFNTINSVMGVSEKLFKCLTSIRDKRKQVSVFDLNRAIANLATDSPANFLKAFKARLDRSFLYITSHNNTTDKKLHTLFCRSLVERVSYYADCIKELQRLDKCMSKQNSKEVITDHILPIKLWLIAIQNLNSCKIYIDALGSASVRCNFDRRMPRTTMRQVKYIYEKILNRRISGRASLHHVAKELGNVLSRSRWGRQFAYEICQYFMIYQEGQKKLIALSKNATKDKIIAIRYREISKSLSLYKNGILRMGLIAINNFHLFTLMLQKFLIQSIKVPLKETWQNHINILVCISQWMKKLLELFECTELDNTDVGKPISTTMLSVNMTEPTTIINYEFYNRNNQIKHIKYHTKNQIKKETDAALERLMLSMNHMDRMRNGKSILAHLANNLLLVVMFMETISFVSALFYLGEDKKGSNVEEVKEEWISPERERRSLHPTDLAEINAIKNSSMIIEANQAIGGKQIIYKEKISIKLVNNFYHLLKAILRNRSNNKLTKENIHTSSKPRNQL